MINNEFVQRIVDDMSVEDLCGQLMDIHISRYKDIEEFERVVKKIRPGGLFVGGGSATEQIKNHVDIVNKYTKVPVIVSADIEYGPGCCLKGEAYLPQPMSWGACDDEALIEKAGRVTGEICRRNGIHWSFAPVVDISYNKDNPVVNTRAASDKPEQVAKVMGAYVRGMQNNGMMVAGCKHFPGDGVDDRNQHFCTTVNSLSKEEWMNTYGYVYKKMFEQGAASVMVAHIAFPAIEDEIDPVLGAKPGTLSYNIMTKLLKEELGFEGCLVSDAMAMVGTSVMCPPDKLAIEFVKNGGDMLLFPLERDFDYLVAAVKNGELPIERVKDAVKRILTMKMRARLFEDEEEVLKTVENSGDIEQISNEIAEKSITLIRNTQNLIPLKMKKGSKFLIINMQRNRDDMGIPAYMRHIDVLTEELKKRGFKADVVSGYGIDHTQLEKDKDQYDCILINSRINSHNYLGGTLRINWDNIMAFWRGVAVDHPCVIFASFGDPYKLYEFPFLKTYINAYSHDEATFRAYVSAILGENEISGKSPVALKGFFDCEV